jgi:2-polyprenyl-3-methyl-5-hydroxy-6-metoxy-1,4-benzoquinol methylase
VSRLEGSRYDAVLLQVSPDARLLQANDVSELTTPEANWSWAALGSFAKSTQSDDPPVSIRLTIDLELIAGKIGIFLSGTDVQTSIGSELTLEGAGRRQVTLEASQPLPMGFCVRSSDRGSAHVKIFDISLDVMRRYNAAPVIRDILPSLLAQSPRALDAVATALSRTSSRGIDASQIGALEISGVAFPLEVPALNDVFSDPIGQVTVAETARLIDLVETFDQQKLADHIGAFGPDYLRTYCRQNIIRVYYLVHLLRDLGLTGGSILEVGSFMGNFSATLRRLGYDVTAVDRYGSYDGALTGYTDYMSSIGVEVVTTSREDERSVIDHLGRYDAVISMAVVEHISDTPRFFLQMLASHVKPGAILALDTPNIARYWNRVALSEGRSIHQPIDVQFFCDPPYEGHHREYTGDELVWMMQQIGCTDVVLRRFDYNVLQFDRLEKQHLEALLGMTTDPTQADTLLIAGRL